MSSSIWTRCGGASNRKRLSARPFRAVEAQSAIKQGDSGDAAYVLMDGQAEVIAETPQGAIPVATIGKNAIVGAHSLVREDVPDGGVVAGCPAKLIRIQGQ